MCLHPINGYNVLDRPIEIAEYQHELDNCDYFEQNDPIDMNHGDLLVMQLNVQGLFNKMSNLNGPKIPFYECLHKQYIKHRTVQCEGADTSTHSRAHTQ